MLILSGSELQRLYGTQQAICDLRPALEAEYAGRVQNPPRTVLEFPALDATCLYMPSSIAELGVMGTKVVSIFPRNPEKGRPTTQGVTILSDARTGEHLALLNASYLTRLRTGALTGIAAEHLARPEAACLGVIGTGGMAPEPIRGIQAVRPLRELRLYNRTPAKAHALAETLRPEWPDVTITVSPTAEALAEASDMIVAATQSADPVLDGHAVQPGTFLSGVGSYLPHMREFDPITIRRASKIVLDNRHGCQHEAGELMHAAGLGFWSFERAYDLCAVVAGAAPGRQSEDEITFFIDSVLSR